jgi:hypothetical protein
VTPHPIVRLRRAGLTLPLQDGACGVRSVRGRVKEADMIHRPTVTPACTRIPLRTPSSSPLSPAKTGAGATSTRHWYEDQRRRCRTDSYRTIDVAVAALSELAAPVIGMRTVTSQASRHAELSPVVSFPTRTMVGPVKS